MWVESLVQEGNVGINVNYYHIIKLEKVLRKEIHILSPVLLNLLVDMLAIILAVAKEEG